MIFNVFQRDRPERRTTIMATATQLSKLTEIDYPDSDGMPMADNTLQYEWIVTIKGGLDAMYSERPDVFVAGDLLWYPVKGEPTIRIAPDAMVAFGRPKGYRGSYKQWEEANVPPQVVFEVLSPGNRPAEMERKLRFYEQYGVQEYYVYDPDNGPLQGWLRAGDRLERIPEMAGFISPLLQIRFEPGEGADNLKIFAPDGTRFLTFQEWVDQSRASQRNADEERQRADEERQRAAAASDRAERLAAKLRELGVEPD
jgi:Uma2 family endonuclease